MNVSFQHILGLEALCRNAHIVTKAEALLHVLHLTVLYCEL